MKSQLKEIMRRHWFTGIALAAAILNITSNPGLAAVQPVQTLSQGGVFPVNGLAGDAFGQVVTFNRDYLFVASPGSQPDNKSISGAVFAYRWDGAQYQLSQTITTGGTGDHLGMLQILSEGEWLMLGVNGTPVGPQENDTIADQDFRGALLIYRLDATGQWVQSQMIDANTPNVGTLNSIESGGIPVLITEQGSNLGLRMALDAEQGWLFISALYQEGFDSQNARVINAGKVFAFRLNRPANTWEFAQSFTSPEGPFMNDGFGAGVAVKGNYAMISNGPIVQGPHPDANSAVYVYRQSGQGWEYFQRLAGTQDVLTPFFFPQMHPDQIQIGDSFGNAIALDENHAVISAPLETSSTTPYTGAAYFFRRKTVLGNDRWVLEQRVESDDPGSFMFGAFSLALDRNLAIIGDLGRTGSFPLQGAAHVFKRTANSWEKISTLVDPAGTPSQGFGTGVALGPDGRLAVGSSPFIGFFAPVIFRPPPAAAPPVAPGKVIIYQRADQ